jgi:hypothetical protein
MSTTSERPEYEGKETTINFFWDLQMSSEWRGYTKDDKFIIMRKAKSGLYILKDKNGKEKALAKRNINYFHDGDKE